MQEKNKRIKKYLESVKRDIEHGIGGAIKESTGRNYSQFIKKYLEYMEESRIEEMVQRERTSAISKTIDEWLYQVEEEWKTTTKAVAAMSVLSYYNYMYHIHIPYKQVRHARRVLGKDSDFDPDIFTREEVQYVMDRTNLEEEGHIKHGFPQMIIIGWNCICRRAEIVQMQKTDVDLSKPYVTVRGVKGSRDFTFTPEDPVNDGLWTALRERVEASDSKYLFPSGKDHVAPVTLSMWFKRYCEKLGLDKTSIHGFCRHTRITMLFEEGIADSRIQELSRHKFLTTTQKYNRRDILRRL